MEDKNIINPANAIDSNDNTDNTDNANDNTNGGMSLQEECDAYMRKVMEEYEKSRKKRSPKHERY